MSEWAKLRWTQARQVLELMDQPATALPAPAVTPQAWLDTQVEQGAFAEAVSFLGHALPRFEAVSWANELTAGASPVRAAVARWIETTDESDRRAIWTLAEDADEDSPDRLLGYAVFFSGGSIAPEDQAPVNPAPGLCGRFAAAAVIKAAYASDAPEILLEQAVARGRALASGEAG